MCGDRTGYFSDPSPLVGMAIFRHFSKCPRFIDPGDLSLSLDIKMYIDVTF